MSTSTLLASPSDRRQSSGGPADNDQPPPPLLAPCQRRWNREWLDEAFIPSIKRVKYQAQRYRWLSTREKNDAWNDELRGMIAGAIEAGSVDKENAIKQTRLHRAIRRYAWPL